ncbi:ATP dependent DNA ligase domain-containing protein [Infundibulicybe gibba]|nr:ATP dependent DNA ligase domain-containing protein [Infundibulicybe gibba]
MMQPTPAPSTRPNSPVPGATQDTSDAPYPTPPLNVGSAPFGILVGLFEKLQSERKHERRRKLIDAWFKHWRNEKGFDLYPVLRLILPQKDRERAVYGLKEKNLAKTYIKLIPLGMRDPDAIRLLNWKKPTEREKTSGDFPTVLFEVVSKRSSIIEDRSLYNRTTPEEQKWIVRIILKDMNILVKETTVFSVFHPDAQDLYNTCSDLKKVAWGLWDATYRLNAELSVRLFHAFAPMLCKRPTKKIEDTVREMGGAEFIIEEKLDGERMQLHKRGNEYFYCSRKGKNYTYLYGSHIGIGSLTPYIDKAFDPRIDDIILDGEMLVWDPVSGRNLPFGTLKTAALDKSKTDLNPRPCFKVFDLLYLNGQSLLHRTTNFRKKNLRQCLTEITGRIEFAVEYRGKTAKDIRTRMDEILSSRGRDNLGETVDLLVVAGNYGRGKRAGGVSTLVCAVYDDRLVDDDELRYSTFVQKPWKTWDPAHPPEFLQTAKRSHEDKGDVYLEPEEALSIRDDLNFADCMSATAVLESMKTERKRKMEKDAGPNFTTDHPPVVVSDPKSRTGDKDRGDLMKMIHIHGGTCAQIATNHPQLFIVYGGFDTPYDLKLLIDKGTYDVIKPTWVTDSIALDHPAPLYRRYFFHPSDVRKDADNYEDEDEPMPLETNLDSDVNLMEAGPEPTTKIKEELDPGLADWFKIDKEPNQSDNESHTASETDDDSDHADAEEEREPDLDDWFKVRGIDPEPTTDNDRSPTAEVGPLSYPIAFTDRYIIQTGPDVVMGENDSVREYDQDQIFKHLCFYLDSPENARKNGLVVNSKQADIINKRRLIIDNGGRVTDLSDPKLTHIALDRRDDSRRLELMKRTAEPRHRHLVVCEFIQACLDEETLLDEDVSPISQFLSSMGITREDLNKRSDQMRQFLTASDTSTTSRIPDRDNPTLSAAATHDPKDATLKRTNSRVTSSSLQGVSPKTPVKSEPTDAAIPLRHYDSMEMVIERKRRQNKREKRSKRDSERLPATSTSMLITQSKSPKSTPLPSFSLDSFMKSRDDRRVPDTTGDSGSTSSAAPVR